MSRGIDLSLQGTATNCRVYRWTGVGNPEGDDFIINRVDPAGTPTESDQTTIDDYGWGATYDYLAVKYIALITPLISGNWQWGIPSRDDLGSMCVRYADSQGKFLMNTTGTSYSTFWMGAGRVYCLECRWYELVGPGNFDPRFKYPGDATARVIQTTGGVLDMQKYDGYVDNTPLISAVL